MKKFSLYLILIACFLTFTGCATSGGNDDSSSDSGLAQFAKSDIDEVTEIHQHVVMHDLKQLMIKLYKRNPRQRYDKDQRSLVDSVNLTFSRPLSHQYPQWQVSKPTDIIRLAFDDNYHGDRVLAFIVGLRLMLMASYDNHSEFFYLTSIDQQKLYNSARNIEIAAWLLAERRDQDGHLFLLSDSMQGKTQNLSFQRLIGEMIATQDNLAKIISQKSGRILKTFVVQAATMAFLPI